MFLILAEVLQLSRVSSLLPESGFWKFLAFHQSHMEWKWGSLHDMIQPSFSFMVGIALPFSIGSRLAKGQSRMSLAIHAFWRAFILICLGIFLRSTSGPQTNFTFEDTLTQIGLGYGFLFLLGFRPVRDQWIALGVILVGYWAAFAMYPLPGPEFNYANVGVPTDWPDLMSGFGAHWNKNSNLAADFDVWFLNLFPRAKSFLFNKGGYVTLNFIPTLGTMILGSIAGDCMRSQKEPWSKVKWLAFVGVLGVLLGGLLGITSVCPVVKRIWTPSWTLYSGGWCFLILAGFYALVDIQGKRTWAFPFMVIGMNSIAAYCMDHLWKKFIFSSLKIHLGSKVFLILGSAYEPLLSGAAALFVFWCILYWMYKQKLFIRI